MVDDDTANESDSALTDEELVVEIAATMYRLGDYRDLLEDLDGDGWFRLRFRDDVTRSDLARLSTTHLIGVDTSRKMGHINDYQTTDLCSWLLRVAPPEAEISEAELDAIHSVGTELNEMPASGETWKLRDIDADVADRSIGVLRDGGLVEATNEPIGHANTWRCTERLDELRHTLLGIARAV